MPAKIAPSWKAGERCEIVVAVDGATAPDPGSGQVA
jgi:hypothetical protein